MLINWLGWSTLASKPNIFGHPFTDSSSIPATKLGDAILAADFGIIPAQGGKFLPNNSMTVADAAITIARVSRTKRRVIWVLR